MKITGISESARPFQVFCPVALSTAPQGLGEEEGREREREREGERERERDMDELGNRRKRWVCGNHSVQRSLSSKLTGIRV